MNDGPGTFARGLIEMTSNCGACRASPMTNARKVFMSRNYIRCRYIADCYFSYLAGTDEV
jgi:hypothetical protein